mgnify:CR=1 FL=1
MQKKISKFILTEIAEKTKNCSANTNGDFNFGLLDIF